MRVDFYQLGRDPVEQVVAMLARKVRGAGERLVVVSGEAAQRAAISNALWAAPDFLAHGEAGGAHDARQPVLLASECSRANGAGIALLADGQWRPEAGSFARVMLLFGPDATKRAQQLWRQLRDEDAAELHIFKQGPGGGWREGA